MPEIERIQVGIRIPKDTYERLRAEAEVRGLSLNQLAVKGIEEFLGRLIPADEVRLTR